MNLQSMLELRWPQHTCSAFGFASSTHGHHGYEDTLAHPTLSEGCDGMLLAPRLEIVALPTEGSQPSRNSKTVHFP
jgi:hypothetical protein